MLLNWRYQNEPQLTNSLMIEKSKPFDENGNLVKIFFINALSTNVFTSNLAFQLPHTRVMWIYQAVAQTDTDFIDNVLTLDESGDSVKYSFSFFSHFLTELIISTDYQSQALFLCLQELM